MVVLHGSLCSQSARPASRKRKQPTDNVTALSSKKRKLVHPSFLPAQFWDGLSKTFLTRNALRELNRRNSQWQRNRTENSQSPIAPRRSRRLRASRISAESVDQLLRQYSSTCLKGLKRSATHGGPDLSDLRGFPMSSNRDFEKSFTSLSSLGRRKRGPRPPRKSLATPNTTTARSTGPHDRNFHQHLIDHGIYPDRYRYPDGRVPPRPANLEDIRMALRQPRPSLSPSQTSEEKFEDFQQAVADASKESRVIADVIPLIEGYVGDRRCVALQTPFTNLHHLTNGTLVAASPDLCYGARPEQLDRRVREVLSGQVVPSTQADLLVAPNYFIEVKGPDGSAAVAQRRIIHDMALGERGQAALLAVGEPEPVYDQRAHTLGYIYQDGHVRMYAIHMIKPLAAGARPEYVTTLVDSYSLDGNFRSFCEGIRACRNGRDWAKRQRELAIAQANQRAAALDTRLRDESPLLSEGSVSRSCRGAPQARIQRRVEV